MRRAFLVLLSLPIAVAATFLIVPLFQHEDAEPPADHASGVAYEAPARRRVWEERRLRDPATGKIPDKIRHHEMVYAATLPSRGRSESLFKGAAVQDYGWSHRGPWNIGGRTRGLALDITGEDTILAGGVSGGMWRSTNRGVSWARVTSPSQLPSVTCVAQDPRPGRHHIWYHGTGEIIGGSASGDGATYSGDGLLKSTDNGRTWQSLTSTATGRPHTFDQYFDFVWNIAIDPSTTTEDRVYAATYGGIYRSADGGETWKSVIRDALRPGLSTDVAVTQNGTVYATISGEAGRKGIWRSADGITWNGIMPPGWPGQYRRIVIGLAPSNPNVVYFLAETPGSGFRGLNFRGDTSWSSLWKYTYVSGDGSGAGGVWENRSANLPAFGGSFGDFNPQFSYNLHINVKPDNENVVFIGGTNLYRSNDGFATPANTTWIGGYRDTTFDNSVRLELHYPEHHPDQHNLFFSKSNPNVIYSANDGGVQRCDDAMSRNVVWTPLNSGYLTSQFYVIAIDHGTPGSNLIVGGMQDNGTYLTTSTSLTAPWNWIGSGDGSYCAVADGASSIYVSKQEGKSYRVLLDDQGNLKEYTRIDPEGGSGYLFINPFVLDPSDTKMMFLAGGTELWRNHDLTQIPMNGQQPTAVNWTRLQGASVGAGRSISAVAVSRANPSHRVYYGTDDGRVLRLDAADGASPTAVNITGSGFPANSYISCLTVDPRDGNRAVAVFANYNVQSMFLTENAGETWTPIGGNLEERANGNGAGPSCRWFSVLHRPNGTLYLAGTSTGLYSTTRLDGMNTVWKQEGAETIGNVVVDMIVARESDGLVVIGTHANGIYSATIDALLDVENSDGSAVTGGLQLDPITPNPVRETATISFTIPAGMGGRTPVRLGLYDVMGREVALVLDSELPPGVHTQRLESGLLGGLAAGTYFCRLQAGSRVMTRSVTVMGKTR